LHSHPGVKRLGDIQEFVVNRGEINQTVFADYITTDKRHSRLLKGAEIARFRERTVMSQGIREWFDEARFRRSHSSKRIHAQRRIATQRITGVDEQLRVVATVIDPPCYFADSTNSITVTTSDASLEYLLAILNSRLTQWRFRLTSTNNNVSTNELEALPIRVIDQSDSTDRSRSDRLVVLSKRMVDLNRQRREAMIRLEKTTLERELAAVDAEIDAQVYDLYELTAEEISLVEGSASVDISALEVEGEEESPF
jgi:adenine-specific DNA-methyltransferase